MNHVNAFFLSLGSAWGLLLIQRLVWPRRYRIPLTLLAVFIVTLATVLKVESVAGFVVSVAQAPAIALALASWSRHRRIVVRGCGRRFRWLR